MGSSPTEAPDSVTKPKPDVNAPTDRITQQAQAGADNLSATSPFRAGKDSTTTASTDMQVKTASEQMSMGAGIGTAGKTESFQASDGSTIQGQTYTSKDGTFMKVAGGDDGKGTTYQIEQGDNGQRALSKIDSDGNKEAVQLKQQNDNGSSGRGAEATPTPQQAERAPQPVQQQPEASAERTSTADKAALTEKPPTPSSPEASMSNPSRSNAPEASISSAPEKQAASPERQAAPSADAAATSTPRNDQPRNDQPRSDQPRSDQPRSDQPRSDQPRGEQSFAPPGHTDTPTQPAHTDTQVSSPQVERTGNPGTDRSGSTNYEGSGGNVDRSGSTVDRSGSTVDRSGNTIDRSGNTVDRSGATVDRSGNPGSDRPGSDRPGSDRPGSTGGYEHPGASVPGTGDATTPSAAPRPAAAAGDGGITPSPLPKPVAVAGEGAITPSPAPRPGAAAGEGAITPSPLPKPVAAAGEGAITPSPAPRPGAAAVEGAITPSPLPRPGAAAGEGAITPSPAPRPVSAGGDSLKPIAPSGEAAVITPSPSSKSTVVAGSDAGAATVTPTPQPNRATPAPAEAPVAAVPSPRFDGGGSRDRDRDLGAGREGLDKHGAPSTDASQTGQSQAPQPFRQIPPVVDASATSFHPEGQASPQPPFAGPLPFDGGPRAGRPGDPPGRPGEFQGKPLGADGLPPAGTPLPFRNIQGGQGNFGGPNGELGGQPRMPNPDANVNPRQSTDAGSMTGLRPPGAEAPGAAGRNPIDSFAPTDTKNMMPPTAAAGAEAAAALNAASRAGADNAAVNAASRTGAENAAMLAGYRPGSADALAKVAAPADVLAPTAAQNKMLQQAGFNASNPADASFLASARAQLLSTHLNDGTGNTTLATALNGANPANLNRLAVLMTGKADATANNVVLNEANIARLNALFKPDASAMHAGMAMSLDAKNAAALGLAGALAGRQPALSQMNQKEVYGELNKLGSQLIVGQKLAMADLISRNLVRPTDLVAGAGLLANKLGAFETKTTAATLTSNPENALSLANAIAAARARALDVHGEVTPGKPVAVAPHHDLAEGIGLPVGKALPLDGKGLIADGKGLVADGKGLVTDGKGLVADGKLAIADSRIGLGGKPTAITSAEALLNTRAAADAARANATKITEVEGNLGSNLTLPARKDMADLGDKLEPKKKPEGKGENQGFSIDGSLLTGAALRLFGDKKDEKTDETNASNKVDETKSQRRKYLIKAGDTLNSIAQESFGDSKMSVLIAAVNSEVIAKDTDMHAPLEAGMSIWLPSEMEVEDFLGNVNTQVTDAADHKLTPEEELARRFGNGWDGAKTPTADAAEPQADLMTAATAALASSAKRREDAEKRRENVEKLLGPLSEKPIDYIKYTVRLGDTLKSVATKHPALKDVALWELVASVNEIQLPGNNASAVKLTRGSSLRLPTIAEIEEFRNSNSSKKTIGNGPNSGPRTGGTTGARSIVFPPGNPLAITAIEKQDQKVIDEHAVTRASAPIRDAGASLLRAGGFVKDQPRTHDDATIVTTPLERLPRPEISKPITTDKPSVENIKILSEDCRVVRRHQVDATGRLYQAQLEVLRDGVWNSVMMYNISDGNCWRKSINELGVTEVLQLDLPTAAIHQMLESDFANNWQEYRDRTLNTANAY